MIKRITLILLIISTFQIQLFCQANYLRMTKEEIKNHEKGIIISETTNSITSQNLTLVKTIFHFDSSGKCFKVMFLTLSPQMQEMWMDIVNENYTLEKENYWVGIERDFTIKVKYIKNAGELGDNGVFIFEED